LLILWIINRDIIQFRESQDDKNIYYIDSLKNKYWTAHIMSRHLVLS
jgi:hypothetical protein